jgi:hypothetical protein
MTDWIVWPIFAVQLVAFGLLFFPQGTVLLGIRLRTLVMLLLFAMCITISASLDHDSMTTLNLYF